MKITIPHNYTPRHYQVGLYNCLADGYRRAVAIWHRRAGKDKSLINIAIKEAMQRVGTYFYFFPTYNQGRKILWDGMDKTGFPFLGHIPEAIRDGKPNNTEMKLRLTNGSAFQVIGTDNIDTIVGTNPIGCVFSEFSLQDPIAWEFIRPILRENGGWAIFNYTPRGHNHGHALYEMAKGNPDWYCECLDINATGALTEADIQAERDAGMPEDLIQQEYYCSFEAAQTRQLIPFVLANDARRRILGPRDYSGLPPVVGVDVGGRTVRSDKTVITIRQGLKMHPQKVFRGYDTMEVAQEVAVAIDEYGAVIAFVDDDGIGVGVTDRCRQLGYNVMAVHSGGSAANSIYVNKRAEMWWLGLEWLESGGAFPADDRELVDDVTAVWMKTVPSGKRALESKDDVKERILRSPDKGDSWILTYAMPMPVITQPGEYDYGWKQRMAQGIGTGRDPNTGY
jgi:hypothetical protein